MQNCVHGELTHVPCLFIFGDSLSDSGNNNNLPTTVKPNYKPYGIDFPKGQQLGFKKFIPPFANIIGSDILKGVNYASGAAGIREETGKHNLALHNVGARKLVLVGLGQIGCTPHAIGIHGLCAQKQNNNALIFSHKLRSRVDKFNIQHLDSKSIFINSTAGTLDISLGFKVANGPCCPVRSDGMCIRDSTPCINRNEYIFYDGFHPTSAVNYITALTLYDSASNPGTTYPMDIKRLVQHTVI
ncbi:hypothetical protein TSUD_384020 [Trifolium subterraneum]|uniref:GDSL esterase/lipase n=1 Tax=Trifolium subterraneum TaxID=3900 RepID=A0A2Z6MSD2_TRISU|nr:hypothetical protein TSUD_384020 [Trifolium subterraneum]